MSYPLFLIVCVTILCVLNVTIKADELEVPEASSDLYIAWKRFREDFGYAKTPCLGKALHNCKHLISSSVQNDKWIELRTCVKGFVENYCKA